jgi:hypothetical protein
MACGQGSLTPQDPLKKLQDLFKRMGPPLVTKQQLGAGEARPVGRQHS